MGAKDSVKWRGKERDRVREMKYSGRTGTESTSVTHLMFVGSVGLVGIGLTHIH